MRLYPLGGQTLAFGYLFASHPRLGSVFVTLRIFISLGRREIVPHIGAHIVLWDAFAIGVHTPEEELETREPLLGC